MATVSTTKQLHTVLQEEGFPLPENCRHVELRMDVNSLFILVYECHVDDDQLGKLGRALERLSKGE